MIIEVVHNHSGLHGRLNPFRLGRRGFSAEVRHKTITGVFFILATKVMNDAQHFCHEHVHNREHDILFI